MIKNIGVAWLLYFFVYATFVTLFLSGVTIVYANVICK